MRKLQKLQDGVQELRGLEVALLGGGGVRCNPGRLGQQGGGVESPQDVPQVGSEILQGPHLLDLSDRDTFDVLQMSHSAAQYIKVRQQARL